MYNWGVSIRIFCRLIDLKPSTSSLIGRVDLVSLDGRKIYHIPGIFKK